MSTITAQISLSVEAVTKEIYALSAMRNMLSSDAATPQLLTSDNRKAINAVIRSAFLSVVMDAVHNVITIHPSEETSDVMPLTIKMRAGTSPDTLAAARRALESAVAVTALAICYSGVDRDTAADYSDRRKMLVNTVKALLGATLTPPRIRPHFF